MRARAFVLCAVAVGCSGLAVSRLSATGAAPLSSKSLIAELVADARANPGDAATRLRIATILLQQGDDAAAQPWIDDAATLDPSLHERFLAAFERRAAAIQRQQRGGGPTGPDVILSGINTFSHYGAVGGVRAYSIGSDTCNIGDADLTWTFGGTPGLAQNMYRLHNGRLEQLGQGWVKMACCAFQSDGCDSKFGCISGSGLGPGCLDVYDSAFNGAQNWLAPRSGINAFTGQFSPFNNNLGDAIFKRIQVSEADLSSMNFPGALYFVEGLYVGSDDAQSGKAQNNATYRRVTIGGTFALTGVDASSANLPAIHAWRDYGLGVGMPADSAVEIVNVDVPSEGRFVAAAKPVDNGDGTWRYEYAVYNLNSDRSGGSFTIPLPAGAVATGAGFKGVPYHSGEIYDNAAWTIDAAPGAITWSSPQTFAQNANSNALRWGTMYNFWFTTTAAPGTVDATLGLFKPHAPQSVSFQIAGPGAAPCPADLTGDGVVSASDLAALLGAWNTPDGDITGDMNTNASDLAALLGAWGPCS